MYDTHNVWYRSLAIIKPDAIAKKGAILELISQNDFLITQLKMCHLSRDQVQDFYSEHRHKPFFK